MPSNRKSAICAATLLLATQTFAAEDFIAGVFAPSPELCEAAESEGLQAIFERGDVVLTARGILGIEYHCDFLQVLEGTRTPGFVVTALCEEPGTAFPDVLAIVPRGEGQLELSSTTDAAGGEPSINSGLYHVCTGVDAP